MLVGCACLCKSAARQDSDPAPTGTAQVNPSSRRARRETGPLASERPGGPVLPLGAASCGLAVYSLRSPCAPLLPVWGVDRARHTVPPPPGCLALPSPPHRHPLHARASGSAAAACRGPPDHRLAAPFPPRCLQRIHARRAARHHRQLGGRVGKLINRPPTGGDLTFSWKEGHICTVVLLEVSSQLCHGQLVMGSILQFSAYAGN